MDGTFVQSCGGPDYVLALINKHSTGAKELRQDMLYEVFSS
jgi:hypothetical protein